MDNRLILQKKLEDIIGNKNVYFQPPASVKISYPCVIYSIGIGDAKYADDRLYKYINSYEVIFIYKSPKVDIIEKVLNEFQMCGVSRTYISDNLNHYTFRLYF